MNQWIHTLSLSSYKEFPSTHYIENTMKQYSTSTTNSLPLLSHKTPTIGNQHTQSHGRDIKNPFCNYKAHWEEQVGGWQKW
jgi:hypothetical protein